MIENFKFTYRSRGKHIFVPTKQSERKGYRIIEYFKRLQFPVYFYHYNSGGHVAALHAHLKNKLFFKIDIQNFYYSIARERVTRALRSWGYPGAQTRAKWSCVRNPLGRSPRHVLPIGFVQSPLLASLVLMKSPVSQAIERAIENGVTISVYLDDFIGSANDKDVLETAYNDIRETCTACGLIPNPNKLIPPSEAIEAFNCDLTYGSAEVQQARIDRYLSEPNRTPLGDASFELYKQRVESENILAS